jgi:UDP-glucose 4-epimerase
MKILITGGAGFVGSHLTDRLLARGETVTVIDNFSTARRDNLTKHPQLTLVEGSITEQELVDNTFESFQPDIVVHTAASYKDPDNWVEDIRTNVLGTANIVKASLNHKVSRLIYFQTALCYGLRPIEQPITLHHPINPNNSSYAISKTAGEQYIQMSGIDYISLRLANVYGPRQQSGPVPIFFKRLTEGKGCFVTNTRRDFIFVEDLGDIAIEAIDGKGTPGPYHVSSGTDYAIQDLFDAVIETLGVQAEAEQRERNPDDAPSILLDPSRTHAEFQWAVKTPLADGIAKTVAYYKEYGVTGGYTHLRGMSETEQKVNS